MIFKICSLYDCVANSFLNCSLENSTSEAIRNFRSSLISAQQKNEGLFATNPNDFELVFVGDFDSETGEIINNPHEVLMHGQFLIDNHD